MRRIEGLQWARWGRNPWPKRRVRGVRAAGLRYEKSLARFLQSQDFEVRHGAWIEFEDRNGRGFAQPDFIVEIPEGVVILEAKLSETPRAWGQLEELYSPLVAELIPGKQFLAQVCRNLRRGDGDIVEDFSQIPLVPRPLWHWLEV